MSTAVLSFTGTAHAVEVFASQGKIERAPAPETCIQWELKFGLYKLQAPKETADDWIWIADHVVSKGIHKCFVIVGVRMSTLEAREDLTLKYEDLQPLAIVPMKNSTGELIEEKLEAILQASHGIPPLGIVIDHGSDLKSGVKRFSQAHPEVCGIYDITHKIARLYEYELKEDHRWEAFAKQCADFKKQVQLTEYSKLAPPNQRTKARWHNIDILVDWAVEEMDCYKERSLSEQKRLSWLKGYEMELIVWQQLIAIGRESRDFIRRKGLTLDSYNMLTDKLICYDLCPRAEKLACNIIDFIEVEGSKVAPGRRVIGTSEILESLFGRHKIIGEKGPKPLGRTILSMASRIGQKPTEPLVQEAFETIKERDVNEWLARAFA